MTELAVSVQGLYDHYLESRRSFNGNRPTAQGALWRASNIGMCLKRQWLEAKGVPHIQQPDTLSLRRFAVGDETARALVKGWWHQGILLHPTTPRDPELSLYDPQTRLGGHVDAVIGGRVQTPPEDVSDDERAFLMAVRSSLTRQYGPVLPVIGVEIKTTNSRSWHWASKQNRPVAGEHQLLQAASYAVLAEKVGMDPMPERWVILSVSKDDGLMAESGVTRAHREEVLHRVAVLNEAYDTGNPPPCTCHDGWEARFCPFFAGKVVKEGKSFKAVGECCGV